MMPVVLPVPKVLRAEKNQWPAQGECRSLEDRVLETRETSLDSTNLRSPKSFMFKLSLMLVPTWLVHLTRQETWNI